MRPTTVTVTGNGSTTENSQPVPINWRGGDTTLGFSTDGSTTGFTAQYTLEDQNDYDDAAAWNTNAVWYSATTINSATVNTAEVVQGAVRGVRLQADASGTDTGTMIILQRDWR